jgi:LemA protein
MVVGWIIGGIIALVVLAAIIALYYYNRFIVLENRIDNSLSQIDVQLKKRADLVPSLVKIVKGFATHEKKIMTEVTNARKELVSSRSLAEKVKAGDRLQRALSTIFAIAENYPQLRSNENFLHLQQELSAIEDRVAYARQYYNDSVMEYENASEQFPGVFFFNLYGKTKKQYLKITEQEKKMPEINL